MIDASRTSMQTYARVAGVLYAVIIVFGIWSEVFVRSALVVPGDAATTAANIVQSEGLFRLSMVADTVMALSDVALAVLLYVLLKPVSATLALMAAAFRLVQTAIVGGNLLNQYAALAIFAGGAPTGLSPDPLAALGLLYLQTHGVGYDLGLLFFGINSLLVGYLVFRSTYIPRAIGLLMAGAGLVYLAGSYLVFLAPAMVEPFAPAYLLPVIAETSLCVWLIVRGVNLRRWEERQPSAALA